MSSIKVMLDCINTFLDIFLKIIALLALFYYLFRHIQLLKKNKEAEDLDKENRKNAEEKMNPRRFFGQAESYLQPSNNYQKVLDDFQELKDKNAKGHLELQRDNLVKSMPTLMQ